MTKLLEEIAGKVNYLMMWVFATLALAAAITGFAVLLAVGGCTSWPFDWPEDPFPLSAGQTTNDVFPGDKPRPLVSLAGNWTYRDGRWQRDDGDSYWVAVAWNTCEKLRAHESVNGKFMVGDEGGARGWLHQHRDHWQEGCRFIGVDWPWPDATEDWDKCRHVALAYWFIHARPWLMAANQTELIRRFRLPNDPYRESNDVYVRKVLGQ